MKKGLVLGKFMPLHNGHLALIDFALRNCDELTVLLCYHDAEPIPSSIRENWLQHALTQRHRTKMISLHYHPAVLTDSSDRVPEYAKAWAAEIKKYVPQTDVLFTSEAYGNNLAFYLDAVHVPFDYPRELVNISASLIRQKPITYWHFLPTYVQPFFVKKIIIVGSESTGKSTLTENLALHYQTSFVPEMAREIIEHTEECTYQHLFQIAELHAVTILAKTHTANKLLFCDTDVTITRSYSRFLFNKPLELPAFIEEANKGDLYLFLETDCAYVQDGTRLSENERALLSDSHKQQLNASGISYKSISGNWDERFAKACTAINEFITKY